MRPTSKVLALSAFAVLAISLASSPPARADSNGIDSFFQSFFGSDSEKSNVQNCNKGGSGPRSLLGFINMLFCHFEKDFGVTGPGTYNKTDGQSSLRLEVSGSAGGGSVTGGNGKSYDFVANVWYCLSSCTTAASFNRVLSIAFSRSSDNSINKGYLIFDIGGVVGAGGTSAYTIDYDVGGSTATKAVTARLLANYNDQAGNHFFAGRFDATKAGSVMTMTGEETNATPSTVNSTFRLALQVDTSANTGALYFEVPANSGVTAQTGIGLMTTGDLADQGGTRASPLCFARTSDGNGGYNYSSSGSGCSVPAWPPEGLTTVGNYSGSTIAGNWNGMAVHPASLN